MKLTEVSVWKSQKIQIEQYEPYDFAYGMKAEVGEGDDPEEIKKKLEEYIDRWLSWEVLKWKNPKKAITKITKGDTPF